MSGEASGPLLRLSGLSAGYEGVAVVHDLDLTVAAGEVVALVGANGSGKTTTLLTVSGLIAPLGGGVELFGQATGGRRGRRALGWRPRRGLSVWRRARRGLAHVAEDRGLFFDLTAAENLRLGHPRSGPAVDRATILGWFPPLEAVLDQPAGRLSGGEQQMLALARAVIGGPRLLLVDELSLGLAPIIVEGLMPVLRSIADETGAGILVVEQHVGLVLSIADRAALLRRGRLAWSGPAAELAQNRDLVESGYLGEAPA